MQYWYRQWTGSWSSSSLRFWFSQSSQPRGKKSDLTPVEDALGLDLWWMGVSEPSLNGFGPSLNGFGPISDWPWANCSWDRSLPFSETFGLNTILSNSLTDHFLRRWLDLQDTIYLIQYILYIYITYISEYVLLSICIYTYVYIYIYIHNIIYTYGKNIFPRTGRKPASVWPLGHASTNAARTSSLDRPTPRCAPLARWFHQIPDDPLVISMNNWWFTWFR